MPPHRTYIETHLGGGAVLRAKMAAEESIGVDVDPWVVARWMRCGPPDLTVVGGDAVTFLRSRRFAGDELVYSDPPYLPATRRARRVYRHEYDVEGHRELIATLRTLPCPVMVSGYPSVLYDELLHDWERETFPCPSQSGMRQEVVWMNYARPRLLHDHRHIGSTYREREVMRRRRKSLLKRVASMSNLERNALLAELAADKPEDFLAVASWLR